MSYYISTTLNVEFARASAQVEAALKQEGFGVISRIDIRETLKAKIGVDFRPYPILGACNPSLRMKRFSLRTRSAPCYPATWSFSSCPLA